MDVETNLRTIYLPDSSNDLPHVLRRTRVLHRVIQPRARPSRAKFKLSNYQYVERKQNATWHHLLPFFHSNELIQLNQLQTRGHQGTYSTQHFQNPLQQLHILDCFLTRDGHSRRDDPRWRLGTRFRHCWNYHPHLRHDDHLLGFRSVLPCCEPCYQANSNRLLQLHKPDQPWVRERGPSYQQVHETGPRPIRQESQTSARSQSKQLK